MRAAVIKQHGPPESIIFEKREIPTPNPTQVLIQIKACGLNHLDLWVRKGVPGHKFPLPLIPGSDITGVIIKTGSEVKKFKIGDKVIINPGLSCGKCPECLRGQENLCAKSGLLGETTDGGCQEYMAIDDRQVHLLPASLSFEQGACIPIAYVTAWQMLVGKARVQPREHILIHAAGSGVSLACIQIAKLHQMHITVTSTSDEKLEHAKKLGVHHTINTAKESFFEAIKKQTEKQGLDVVVDHVAGPHFMDSIKCLKRGGRLVSCGATAGGEVTIHWQYVFFKNIALLGSTYGTTSDFNEVLSRFSNGQLSVVLDSVVKLEELSKAHLKLESRHVFGKSVVCP